MIIVCSYDAAYYAHIMLTLCTILLCKLLCITVWSHYASYYAHIMIIVMLILCLLWARFCYHQNYARYYHRSHYHTMRIVWSMLSSLLCIIWAHAHYHIMIILWSYYAYYAYYAHYYASLCLIGSSIMRYYYYHYYREKHGEKVSHHAEEPASHASAVARRCPCPLSFVRVSACTIIRTLIIQNRTKIIVKTYEIVGRSYIMIILCITKKIHIIILLWSYYAKHIKSNLFWSYNDPTKNMSYYASYYRTYYHVLLCRKYVIRLWSYNASCYASLLWSYCDPIIMRSYYASYLWSYCSHQYCASLLWSYNASCVMILFCLLLSSLLCLIIMIILCLNVLWLWS